MEAVSGSGFCTFVRFVTARYFMLGNRVKMEGFSNILENILFIGSFIQLVHSCVEKVPVIHPLVG